MLHDRRTARRRVICTTIVLLIILGMGSAYAQVPRIEIPASMNPVGSGARALGMGGAFIGVADDATAASWNPGGLIQLETPEISIVGAYVKRIEDLSFDEDPEASGTQEYGKGSLNYLSAVLPFSAFNRNMIVSLNYQNLYDFTRSWDLSLLEVTTTEDSAEIRNIDLEQDGGVGAIGLAYGIQVSPSVSFGLTLNLWPKGIDNGWEQKMQFSGNEIILDVPYAYTAEQKNEYTFSGINANLGIIWNVTSRLTLGAVLKTPFTADLEHQYTEKVKYEDGSGYTVNEDRDEELDMPMSYGLGLSYRFSDRFTVDIDVYRTQWDDYILRDENGNETSPVNNKSKGEAGIDPTIQVRTGGEYLIITDQFVLPLRGGVFYDPAPAEGSPDDYYGFSLGSGIAYKKIVFDLAYQFRFGNDVGTYLLESQGFSEDVREHTLYASIIYHF